jgi:hypothetical protein
VSRPRRSTPRASGLSGLPIGPPVRASQIRAVLSSEAVQHANRVLAATFDPNGERVVTASADTARIWDARTGDLRGQECSAYHKISYDAALIEAVFVDVFLDAHTAPPSQIMGARSALHELAAPYRVDYDHVLFGTPS